MHQTRRGTIPEMPETALLTASRPRRVYLAEPNGYCAGVYMAVKALVWMVQIFDAPVYCYHEIVHNRFVVESFERAGVVFVDSIDEVPEGAPVMLSAHGSAPGVVEDGEERAGIVIDAVCPLVAKVHHEVKRRAAKGFDIIFVGPPGSRRGGRHRSPGALEHHSGRTGDGTGRLHAERSQQGGAIRPDHPRHARMGGGKGRGCRALPELGDLTQERSLLRHHQPPGGSTPDERRM